MPRKTKRKVPTLTVFDLPLVPQDVDPDGSSSVSAKFRVYQENVATDVVSNLVTWLRSQIPDPISRGKEWIYPDYPRFEDVTWPRISVTMSTGLTNLELGMGNQGKIYRFLVDIDVWLSRDTRGTVKGNIYGGTLLRDLLADAVIRAIDDHRVALQQAYGWVDARTMPIRPFPYDEEMAIHRKTVPVLVEIERAIT